MAAPTNAHSLFNEQVPNAIAKNPDKAKEIGAIYLFKITGPDGGTWTVDLLSSPPFCKPGEHGSPQCTVEASDADFRISFARSARRSISSRSNVWSLPTCMKGHVICEPGHHGSCPASPPALKSRHAASTPFKTIFSATSDL